ncbi:hypothetical protein QBC40DRAFT_325700 [Triangularia verruculosa]|uniref:DUF6594 domain-containing protein n=1 Tax=Triangularia verruculosa TaxID=2587418 RepID=A0AAN6XQP3_9PEZI|nr:hypothetical protein QBC40DRAFT_325700 [Triangularia verruculosa]
MTAHQRQHMENMLDRYRSGYPRYSALLSSHPSFQAFRRFTRLRMRLALIKQDEIARLEHKLDDLDSAESRSIFLGCIRRDQNEDRRRVLESIEKALSEYDNMLEQTRRATSMPKPSRREVDNLKNWTAGTACISRKETEYLGMDEDIGTLAGPVDRAFTYSESVVEDCTYWLDKLFGRFFPKLQARRYKVTADSNILLLGPHLRRLSRILAVVAVTLVILVPTIFIPSIPTSGGRIIASVFSATVFLVVISFFTTARTVDIFASGASYAAVLVALTTATRGGDDVCCPALAGI